MIKILKNSSNLEKLSIALIIIGGIWIYFLLAINGYNNIQEIKQEYEYIGFERISYQEFLIELEEGEFLRSLEVIKSENIVILNYKEEIKVVEDVNIKRLEVDLEDYYNDGNYINQINKQSLMMYYFDFITIYVIICGLSMFVLILYMTILVYFISSKIEEYKKSIQKRK